MIKILHMAAGRPQISPEGHLAKALQAFGEFEIIPQCKEMTDEEVLASMRQADVLLTLWDAQPVPVDLAKDPGNVRYILHLTGTCRQYIPIEIIRSGIPVTNWGDTPANAVAEGAMALLLAVLKDLRGRIEAVADGKCWGARRLKLPSGTLNGLRVGLYGCGAIGQRFVEMVAPFKPDILVYDPFVKELPASCRRVDSLEDLFGESEAVAIWAGLSDETRGSVTAAHLAKLPDHGIIINAARGEILDQEALFAELKSGRLRAGLDVVANENFFPAGHEAHRWPNLILTCHDINSAYWPERPPQLSYGDRVALNNLKRFVDGEPLRFVIDEHRYQLST